MCCDIPVGRRLFLYNTVCEIILHDYTGDAGAVLDACEMKARHVQDMLNAYDPESELGRMNRLHRPGVPYAVSAELYTLLRRMDRFSAQCQDGASAGRIVGFHCTTACHSEQTGHPCSHGALWLFPRTI